MSGFAALPDFARLEAAVVGDLIADHYLVCEPLGLSREAPVMVLSHQNEYLGAGGAANVARNLRALGARTHCLGVVGRDARGRELTELLEHDGLLLEGLASAAAWLTPTKTRIVAAEARRNLQQVLRIDREPRSPAPRAAREEVLATLGRLEGRLAALVLSDYEYGMVDRELATAALRHAERRTVVVLDPRASIDGFDGLTALTPNVGELARFVGTDGTRLADPRALADAARALLDRVRLRWLLVTRGNLGMALFGEGLDAEGVSVPASGSGNVTDPTGAGDTAAAVFALALAAGERATEAMRLANAASGVVVMENGCAVCTAETLRSALALAPVPARLAGVAPL